MIKAPFVHLHVHSHYSFMWGVSSVDELCRAAAKRGMDTLALTDTNGFYGLMNFLEAAREHHIRPLVGATFRTDAESAVILAKTGRGYELLSRLLTRRHLEPDVRLARELPRCAEDLAVLSPDPKLLEALRTRAECFVEVVPGSSARRALDAARELNIPPVATNAAYFVDPDAYPLHRLVRAIDLNRTFSTLPDGETVSPDRWLKPPETMAAHFPHCPEAVTNTMELARKCRTDWYEFRPVFPHYQDRREDHFSLLLERCRKGIQWRYGRTNAAIEARLKEELGLIRAKGYVDYFLVVEDVVRRRPIHCGRGSAAASLVSYLLGITHVDPLRHRLVFSRFLNPKRKDYPDIDVDFPWDERDDLLEELSRHYGPERMAMVSNHIGFGARAAIREVAKLYGMPAAEIKEVTRRMSLWTHPARARERIRSHPKFRGVSLDEPWPEILRWAARLETVPRHLGTHCGGVILVPDRVSRYVPVQRSPKGVRIIQWEKDQSEQGGLVKIDLLGNRSLAVIRDALTAVERNTGRRLEYADLDPLDDPATLDLLGRGDSMGVFYVESPAMRQLQLKTRRGDFEHLVIHSSIIRPAANRYIREYIRRLHGAPYRPLHPCLEDVLSETYGIMVYQEDVVQAAMALAGFDWAEADGLRKVLSKKSSKKLDHYRQQFYEGCAQRRVSRKIADEAWDMFVSFAGYSFCKPHSASYALVSFKSAFLKAHYPAEFMAAVISNGGGYYTVFAYVSEARRMGLDVLGPDINESDWNYKGQGTCIRMGFQQLEHIRREALESIIGERSRNGRFRSMEDLLQRVRLHPSDAAVLVKSGALDALAGPLNRPQLLWTLEAALRRHRPSGQRMLEAAVPRLGDSAPRLPDLSFRQKLDHEMETLGFVLSVHPIHLYDVRCLPKNVIPAAQLHRYVGRYVRVLGWPITRKEVLTRAGEPMEFVSFEDEHALFESVFFPEAFRRYCRHVDKSRAVLLSGRVESEFGVVSLTVDQVQKLPLNKGRESSREAA